MASSSPKALTEIKMGSRRGERRYDGSSVYSSVVVVAAVLQLMLGTSGVLAGRCFHTKLGVSVRTCCWVSDAFTLAAMLSHYAMSVYCFVKFGVYTCW